MENDIGELLVGITDSIERLAVEASKSAEILGVITSKIIELRKDVDKLIENNQKGIAK